MSHQKEANPVVASPSVSLIDPAELLTLGVSSFCSTPRAATLTEEMDQVCA
jgi:hypothetical protein